MSLKRHKTKIHIDEAMEATIEIKLLILGIQRT